MKKSLFLVFLVSLLLIQGCLSSFNPISPFSPETLANNEVLATPTPVPVVDASSEPATCTVTMVITDIVPDEPSSPLDPSDLTPKMEEYYEKTPKVKTVGFRLVFPK